MIRRITKSKLALAILAVALLVPATAVATHIFDDVEDGRFYADPIEWALNNNITTGSPAGSDTFKPDDPVTRGESVTFLNRYDTNIVQPGLTGLETDVAANTAAAAANTTAIGALDIPVVHWAWVGSGGSTGAGSTGVSSSKSLVGEYVVTFPGDVTDCSWSVAHRSSDGFAVLIDPDYDDEPSIRLSTRASGFGIFRTEFPEDIRVHVTDEAGNPKNSDFNLQVIC